MLMFLVEKPPVAMVVKVWQMESKRFIPPSRRIRTCALEMRM
jgi:hypothetical protein